MKKRTKKGIEKRFDIIPAAPGHNLITPQEKNGTIVGLKREAIVAWRIDTWIRHYDDGGDRYHNFCRPITVNGDCRYRRWAIEHPDGSLRGIGGGAWDNQDELLKQWREGFAVQLEREREEELARKLP